MDYSQRLSLSYYKTIATLNESHKIYLVQHQDTKKIYVKKILDVYNKDVYQFLSQNSIEGIPQIIDMYEEDNQLYVIETYISGCSLQEKIDTTTLSMDDIYQYMYELCTILESLHASTPAIIHRDIKPSNIIVTEHNHVVLLDFNAAKHFSSGTSDTVLLGTQGYAAPEQYGFGSSTPRTDIYALGILLKELISSTSFTNGVYDKIISSCIQINPEDRFESVGELKKQIINANSPTATPSSTPKTLRYFLPPGFRTLKPWKMVVASLFYLFMFWFSSSLNIENTSGFALLFERCCFFLMMLSVVFGCFNYLDIRSLFPLSKHKNRFLRYIGVAMFDIMMVSTILILMVLIVNIFFL